MTILRSLETLDGSDFTIELLLCKDIF